VLARRSGCVDVWVAHNSINVTCSYPAGVDCRVGSTPPLLSLLFLAAVVAADPEPIQPGLSVEDTLTLYFTRPTNRPDVSSTALVQSLLSFTPTDLALGLRGAWLAGGDEGDWDAAERLVITLSGGVSSNISATLLQGVRISILGSGGLRDMNNTCQNASVASLYPIGTWGDASQPQFLSNFPVTALDYGHQPGLGPGDALVLRFNQPVAQVPVGSKTQLDALFVFYPPTWAVDYAGTWLDYMTLLVNATVVSSEYAANATHRAATAVGVMHVGVLPGGNLTSYDGTSLASNASSVLTSGSWGDPVCDGGLHVYSSTTLVVSFLRSPTGSYIPDSYTAEVLVGTDKAVVRSVTLSPVASANDVGLPASVPATSLRYLLPGLEPGASYSVRVAPSAPALPEALLALLPRTLPLTFVDIGGASGGVSGCTCAVLALGNGCTVVMEVTPAAPQLPSIGRTSAVLDDAHVLLAVLSLCLMC
jgi:hypothetical protein